MLLRTAQGEDQAPILSLLEATGLPTEGVSEHFDNFIVADNDSEIVGVAGLEIYGANALLRSLMVAPKAQGTGLGGQLTERALAAARERGVGAVYLLTTTAESFFPRFGFERIGWDVVPAHVRESREFRGACPSSAVAMRASLKGPIPTESAR
jgi:amino-acid N-acetyltransferase